MTREDFSSVRQDLEDQGLSEKDIRHIERRIDSDEGMTWGEFATYVQARLNAAENARFKVSEADKPHLGTFLQKLGFTPQEARELIAGVKDGKTSEVLARIQQKLDAMPPDKAINISRAEVKALARTFKIPGLEKLLAGKLDVDKAGLTNLVGTIQQELGKMEEAAAKAVEQFRDFLGETLEKVLARLRGQQIASGREVTDQAKMIEVKKDELASNHATGKAGKDGRAEKGAEGAGAKSDAKADTKTGQHDAESGAGRQEWARRQAEAGSMARAEKARAEAGAKTVSFEDKKGMEELLARLTPDKSTGGLDPRLTRNVDDMIQAARAQAGKAAQPRQQPVDTQNLMNQVRQGMLKNLGQGGKQLVIRLNPAHLGTLNVLLHVKNKEVRAVIQADRHETGRVIGEQMAQIREALETQGLKVSKLDVSTDMSEDFLANQWQGTEQHNLESRREEMASMRARLKALSKAGRGGADGGRAEEAVQARTDIITENRIDLFA
jgi:flagellar hook-length control protein FliK